jgi:ferredoxin like protein
MIAVNVEEKLFQNRYRVDAGRPHIKIRKPEVCTNECEDKSCTHVCPASCYKAEGSGSVTLITDGCLECG